MWRYSIILLALVGGWCHTLAQTVAFISAAPARMGIKDQAEFKVTISNVPRLVELRQANFGDFRRVEGPFQFQSSSNINGVVNNSVTLTYIIVPTHEGKLTLPPAIARDASGHTYQSNPVIIEVVPGSLAPKPQPQQRGQQNMFGDDDDGDPFAMVQQQLAQLQQMRQAQLQRMQQMQQMARGGAMPQQQAQPGRPGVAQTDPPVNQAELKKDLFIRVTVDKSKVHVGEQITTSYKLYSRIPMQANITKLPALDGFWTQDFEIPQQPKQQEEIVDGKKYQVFLLKKSALFPQQAGTLELDPAEAKGVARIVQQVKRRAADLFNDPFGAGTLMMNDPFFNNAVFNTVAFRDVPVELKSSPVKITVLPVPDKGKPDNYGGAVGQFSIAAKLDKKELTTDDVATFTLTIAGSGNFKLIEAPKLALPNGINTYDPVVTDTITGRSTTISGSKIINYAITPQVVGDYEIPSIAFTYFNPQSGTYTTLHTDPIKISVKPGKHYNPAKRAETPLAIKDIHANAAGDLLQLAATTSVFMRSPGYWSLYILPLLAFTGVLVWKKKSDEESGDRSLIRHKKANKIALQRLVTARKLLQENKKGPFYEEVSKAIWLYLSDKLRIPLSALSREAAVAALNGRKVPQHIQVRFEAVINDCETALYAPGSENRMAATYDDAVKVISDLEGVL